MLEPPSALENASEVCSLWRQLGYKLQFANSGATCAELSPLQHITSLIWWPGCVALSNACRGWLSWSGSPALEFCFHPRRCAKQLPLQWQFSQMILARNNWGDGGWNHWGVCEKWRWFQVLVFGTYGPRKIEFIIWQILQNCEVCVFFHRLCSAKGVSFVCECSSQTDKSSNNVQQMWIHRPSSLGCFLNPFAWCQICFPLSLPQLVAAVFSLPRLNWKIDQARKFDAASFIHNLTWIQWIDFLIDSGRSEKRGAFGALFSCALFPQKSPRLTWKSENYQLWSEYRLGVS